MVVVLSCAQVVAAQGGREHGSCDAPSAEATPLRAIVARMRARATANAAMRRHQRSA